MECAGIDDDIANALIGVLPSLKMLALKGCCCLTDGCMMVVAGNASHNDTIKYNDGADHPFLLALAPQLRNIDVSGCYILTDLALTSLAQGCPNLENIEIEGCVSVMDQGIYEVFYSHPVLFSTAVSCK